MLILNSFVVLSIGAIDVNYWVEQVSFAAWGDGQSSLFKEIKGFYNYKRLLWKHFLSLLSQLNLQANAA